MEHHLAAQSQNPEFSPQSHIPEIPNGSCHTLPTTRRYGCARLPRKQVGFWQLPHNLTGLTVLSYLKDSEVTRLRAQPSDCQMGSPASGMEDSQYDCTARVAQTCQTHGVGWSRCLGHHGLHRIMRRCWTLGDHPALGSSSVTNYTSGSRRRPQR